MKTWTWRILIAAVIVVVIVDIAFLVVIPRLTPASTSELIDQGLEAFNQSEFEEARELMDQVLEQDPNSDVALLIAARACTNSALQDALAQAQTSTSGPEYDTERLEQAAAYLERLPDFDTDEVAQGHAVAGDIYRLLGKPDKAEQKFRQAIAKRSNNLGAHQGLADLLIIEGRNWEAMPHLLQQIKLIAESRAQLPLKTLLLLGDRSLTLPSAELEPRLTKAQQLLKQNKPSEAEEIVRGIIQDKPSLIEAHVLLGDIVVDGSNEAFQEWRAALPDGAEQHPGIWYIYGQWAVRHQQPEAAIRCFWETVHRDPNHRAANYRLAGLLARHDKEERAAPFLLRTTLLNELEQLIKILWPIQRNNRALAARRNQIIRAAELTKQLNRLWESSTYYLLTASLNPQDQWAGVEFDRLRSQMQGDSPLTTNNPADQDDMSSFPLPDWSATSSSDEGVAPATESAAKIAFQDIASEAGVDFLYSNNQMPESNGEAPATQISLDQILGGGVAILDYDSDGWPDLYLAQGKRATPPAEAEAAQAGAEPAGSEGESDAEGEPEVDAGAVAEGEAAASEEPPLMDRLYRNLGNGKFADVTVEAGLGDTESSFGAAVGDFNSDGLPDLYVANWATNRLYQNNGDGTFTDVTEQAGIKYNDWTTSCVMADLNGDALPDLFDVNYIDMRANAPGQDRIYLNKGDGTFEDYTTIESRIIKPEGDGLGVLVARLDDSGNSILVINEQGGNFWFVNTSPAGEKPKFDDPALKAGLALSQEGNPNISRGVAAGDADGDGSLDVFITNMFNRPNTLYAHHGEWFDDETRRAGLDKPSLDKFGFGAQFLDADLDGWLDLVVANGDVRDFSKSNRPDEAPERPDTAPKRPFEMQPQFFLNMGDGEFRELPAEQLGGYFEQPAVGRAVARWDWNRDGREDFVATKLRQPVSLVSNQTQDAGHFVAIKLCGVESDRDAIGAVVEAKIGDRSIMRQLTAGDGYLASNQRQLVFGLGDSTKVDELTVRWPSGAVQTFTDLAADAELLIIEGTEAPVELAGSVPETDQGGES